MKLGSESETETRLDIDDNDFCATGNGRKIRKCKRIINRIKVKMKIIRIQI